MNELLEREFDRKPRIAVVGDSMLDEYYKVSSERLSPEFPIPVMLSPSGEPFHVALGGAANVCAQFKNFNFDVELFSFTNSVVKEIGSRIGIGMEGCVFSGSVPLKKRFYSGHFPLYRMDVEKKDYGYDAPRLKELQAAVFEKLKARPADIVVFSDYGKGIFSDVHALPEIVDKDCITIVDPKDGPAEKWRGCTIIKPNAKEAKNLTGHDEWHDQCECLMADTGCSAVVITREGSGVVGNVMGSWFEYKPESPSEAVSVIGAGDCFVAILSMCMAHSIDIRKAVEIAFKGCSAYVKSSFNTPISPLDLEEGKGVMVSSLARRNFRLAFTNGCFDILHPGHIKLLEFARSKADALVVALNSDESVRRQNKSHGLVNDLASRKAVVAALGCVDYVVDFDEDTPERLVESLRPEVLVKGSDWPNPAGSQFAGEVCLFDLVSGHSTTSMIEKIRSMG
jgi:D-beta-D-heptose 7-phosphate kinase/D-beta-D-heptose 1-phosphate adenosyltransferase